MGNTNLTRAKRAKNDEFYTQFGDIEKNLSNCPLCTLGHDANKQKIWTLREMDADYVTARSKGGSSDINNCQMLCKTHNRAKGNR